MRRGRRRAPGESRARAESRAQSVRRERAARRAPTTPSWAASRGGELRALSRCAQYRRRRGRVGRRGPGGQGDWCGQCGRRAPGAHRDQLAHRDRGDCARERGRGRRARRGSTGPSSRGQSRRRRGGTRDASGCASRWCRRATNHSKRCALTSSVRCGACAERRPCCSEAWFFLGLRKKLRRRRSAVNPDTHRLAVESWGPSHLEVFSDRRVAQSSGPEDAHTAHAISRAASSRPPMLPELPPKASILGRS